MRLQPESIPPALRLLASAVLVTAALAVPPWTDTPAHARAAAAQEGPGEGSEALRLLTESGWAPAPAYVELFAPLAHRASYRTFVSPLGLDDGLRELRSHPAIRQVPGAWEPETLGPLDAFGQSGGYSRWGLIRLYGSLSVRIARGPVGSNGRVVQSWTLVSPYPAPALDRLERGTLLIVLQLPPL